MSFIRQHPKISDRLTTLAARMALTDDYFGIQVAMSVRYAAIDLEEGRLSAKYDLPRALRILAALFVENGDTAGAEDVRGLIELVPLWRKERA